MTKKEKHAQRRKNKDRAVIKKLSREESEVEDDKQLRDYIQRQRRKLRG